MSQNMVSLMVSEEQASSATAAIAQLGQALPGLISLTPDDRKGLLYMGPRSEVFCEQVVRVLGQNPQIVPPRMDLAEALADMDALNRLRPIQDQLRQLQSRVDDTVTALGSDLMDFSLEGYAQLKLSGAAEGLEELRREIGGRFSRRRRKAATPESGPEAA
ncbi:hypothetical protein ACFONC_06750 [Luteimonas soli]|uniref:Uncharacterized protein n=1 Tax=Luteimonas soli TaxID=1648966 RepID=A0ABV7XM47_9GAMM